MRDLFQLIKELKDQGCPTLVECGDYQTVVSFHRTEDLYPDDEYEHGIWTLIANGYDSGTFALIDPQGKVFDRVEFGPEINSIGDQSKIIAFLKSMYGEAL